MVLPTRPRAQDSIANEAKVSSIPPLLASWHGCIPKGRRSLCILSRLKCVLISVVTSMSFNGMDNTVLCFIPPSPSYCSETFFPRQNGNNNRPHNKQQGDSQSMSRPSKRNHSLQPPNFLTPFLIQSGCSKTASDPPTL